MPKYAAIFKTTLMLCLCGILLIPLPVSAKKAAPQAEKPTPAPAAPTAPPFKLQLPSGWLLYQAGECDTLSLYLINSVEPLQQLLFFPRFGPVYANQEQKNADIQLGTISGRSLSRLDMPVVYPLTPENFIRFMPQILQMKDIREFMPNRPGIRNVEVIAVSPQKKNLDYPEARTAIVRILFVEDNRLGEGLFSLTALPSPEVRSNAGGGIGMGYLLYGLTAPKGELSARLPALLAAGRSFTLSAEYDKLCKKNRAEDMPQLLNENQSLKSVLDLLATVWEKRTPAEDMAAEQKSDSLRGVERLYRPATGDVYEFPAGFTATYLAQPQKYPLADLKALPEDPALWLKTPLNGFNSIMKQ